MIIIYITITDVDVATFDDGDYNAPLKSLVVDISAVQSGSGDPSPDNVRPISGWTGANIEQMGKNLIIRRMENRAINSGGKVTVSDSYDLLIAPCKAGVSYTISNNEVGVVYAEFATLPSVGDMAPNGRVVSPDSQSFTASMNGYVAFRTSHGYATPQIEVGAVATPYVAPLTPTIYSVSWNTEAGTVYGGTLDVTTGVLTKTMERVDLGALTWSYSSASTRFSASAPSNAKIPATSAITANIFSEIYVPIPSTNIPETNNTIAISPGGNIQVHDERYSDGDVFKTAMSGVYLVYELAVPVIYELTSVEIKTLLGANNIWADTGKIIKIIYKQKGKANMDNMGGYILFDCGGLNLNTSSEQEIEGIYDKAKDALSKGKPVIVTNCFMGTIPCTPTSVIAWQDDEDTIIATGHVFRVAIEEDDGVTVTNLVAG